MERNGSGSEHCKQKVNTEKGSSGGDERVLVPN